MDKSRREALKFLSTSALIASSALLFAGQISQAATAPTITFFYSSKYGATKDTAHWISQGVTMPIHLVDITDEKQVNIAFATDSQYILGSAVYQDQPMQQMQDFVAKHQQSLNGNTLASFVVCGTQPTTEKNQQRIAGYLRKLSEPLTIKPQIEQQLGGRLVIANLQEKDRRMLTHFYSKVLKKPLVDWDRTDKETITKLAQRITAATHQNALG